MVLMNMKKGPRKAETGIEKKRGTGIGSVTEIGVGTEIEIGRGIGIVIAITETTGTEVKKVIMVEIDLMIMTVFVAATMIGMQLYNFSLACIAI